MDRRTGGYSFGRRMVRGDGLSASIGTWVECRQVLERGAKSAFGPGQTGESRGRIGHARGTVGRTNAGGKVGREDGRHCDGRPAESVGRGRVPEIRIVLSAGGEPGGVCRGNGAYRSVGGARTGSIQRGKSGGASCGAGAETSRRGCRAGAQMACRGVGLGLPRVVGSAGGRGSAVVGEAISGSRRGWDGGIRAEVGCRSRLGEVCRSMWARPVRHVVRDVQFGAGMSARRVRAACGTGKSAGEVVARPALGHRASGVGRCGAAKARRPGGFGRDGFGSRTQRLGLTCRPGLGCHEKSGA